MKVRELKEHLEQFDDEQDIVFVSDLGHEIKVWHLTLDDIDHGSGGSVKFEMGEPEILE